MPSKPIRLVVSGCGGRMGTLISEEAAKEPEHFTLTGGAETEGHPQVGQPWPPVPQQKVTSDFTELLKNADLVIEFTTPEASLAHAKLAAEAKVPMLIGTTGFTDQQLEALQSCSKRIPLFWSPNLSIGIVMVRRTIAAISKLLFNFGLGETTKIQISETHHNQKKDKPSGTAKALAQELLKATGWLIRDEEIEAKREGEVIGLHSVTFRLNSENITIQHEATDRRVFAQGALLVARHFHDLWKEPGWFSMDDFVVALQKVSAR